MGTGPIRLIFPVQFPFRPESASARSQAADAPALAPRTGADTRRTKMIKTFSISALFFMTLGLLAATHAGLPF